MSATKHTPGPWFYRRGDEWTHDVVTLHGELPDGSTNCWTVASINKQREPEHEANARLIAAAPELLEELENILRAYGSEHQSHAFEQWPEVIRAREVIAKATGSAQ
jgi:hypothetical protein